MRLRVSQPSGQAISIVMIGRPPANPTHLERRGLLAVVGGPQVRKAQNAGAEGERRQQNDAGGLSGPKFPVIGTHQGCCWRSLKPSLTRSARFLSLMNAGQGGRGPRLRLPDPSTRCAVHIKSIGPWQQNNLGDGICINLSLRSPLGTVGGEWSAPLLPAAINIPLCGQNKANA